MVTADLKAAEIFKPNKFAKQETLNNTVQYVKNIPFISKILLPTKTNNKVCRAEIENISPTLEAI